MNLQKQVYIISQAGCYKKVDEIHRVTPRTWVAGRTVSNVTSHKDRALANLVKIDSSNETTIVLSFRITTRKYRATRMIRTIAYHPCSVLSRKLLAIPKSEQTRR